MHRSLPFWKKIAAGGTLEENEMRNAIAHMTDGNATPPQNGGILDGTRSAR